jgi:galactokinase
MDQLASSAGVPGVASVIDCRTLQMRSVPLPDRRVARFLVIDSGIRHRNASGEYAARRAACEAAAKELGVPALRDADAYMLDQARAALTSDVYKCALHVVNENPRVLMAAEAMRAGDAERLGALMNLSHASLRDLYRVSCPEVDTLVDQLQQTPGVHGARMTGAGFGGCVVALINAAQVAEVQAAMAHHRSRRGTAQTAPILL